MSGRPVAEDAKVVDIRSWRVAEVLQFWDAFGLYQDL